MHLQIARSINKVGFSIIIVVTDAIINISIVTAIRSRSIIVDIMTNVLDNRGILFPFPEGKDSFLFS